VAFDPARVPPYSRFVALRLPYSYVIYKEDEIYKALSGRTGEVEFSSTDAAEVLTGAGDAAYANGGGTLLITRGIYDMRSVAELKDNVALVGEGGDVTILRSRAYESVWGHTTGMYALDKHNIGLRDLTYYVVYGEGAAICFFDTYKVGVTRCIFGPPEPEPYHPTTIINSYGVCYDYKFTDVDFRRCKGFYEIRDHANSKDPTFRPRDFRFNNCFFDSPTDDGITARVDHIRMNNIFLIGGDAACSVIRWTRGFHGTFNNITAIGKAPDHATYIVMIGFDKAVPPPTGYATVSNVVGYKTMAPVIVYHAQKVTVKNIVLRNSTVPACYTASVIDLGADDGYESNDIIIDGVIVDGLGGGCYRYIFGVSPPPRIKNVTIKNVIERNVTIDAYFQNLPDPLVLENLMGFPTKKSGTATIPAGATSVTFAHGLAGTPTLVVLGATHAEVVDAVWSADATNITITVPAAVTADRRISWYAEYRP